MTCGYGQTNARGRAQCAAIIADNGGMTSGRRRARGVAQCGSSIGDMRRALAGYPGTGKSPDLGEDAQRSPATGSMQVAPSSSAWRGQRRGRDLDHRTLPQLRLGQDDALTSAAAHQAKYMAQRREHLIPLLAPGRIADAPSAARSSSILFGSRRSIEVDGTHVGPRPSIIAPPGRAAAGASTRSGVKLRALCRNADSRSDGVSDGALHRRY